jgi:hypothetical protein
MKSRAICTSLSRPLGSCFTASARQCSGSFEKFGADAPGLSGRDHDLGGLARFMHKDKKAVKMTGTGGAGKEL